MASTGLLDQLQYLNKFSATFHDQLNSILYGEEFKQQATNLQGDSLVWLVDYLDKALDTLDPVSPAFRKCLRELRNICGTRMILPTSYTLSSSLLNIGRQPVASGGSGDIYKGTLNGSNVCVKRVRVYSKEGPKKATKTLYQEAVVWKHLTHPNIVPLLGIAPVPLQLVSEWIPGGDLSEHIRSNPGVNRSGLLSDVAEGLYYLHSCNIVHGDLKGPNILVNSAGCACITDFGLDTVTRNLDSMRSTSDDMGRTSRWTAPEILNEQGTYSKEADVFSFGMVMIEVYTGAVPFNSSLPAAAALAIMNGTRPPRPIRSDFTDELWTLMQHCWDQDPHLRPEVSEVIKVLSGPHPSTATLTIAQTRLFAEHPTGSHTPSIYKKASSSSCHTLQTTPEKSNNSIVPPPTESQTMGTELDERGGQRPYDRSGDQRGGLFSRMPSRRSTTGSEPSTMPLDPQPFDYGELQKGQAHNQVYGHAGGTGKSHTDPQSTRSGRTASRRDMSSKCSQFDLNHDLDDNDEGKYWSEAQRDSRGASRSALSLGTTKQTGGHPSGLENNDEGKYWSEAQKNNSGASRMSGILCEKQFRDCAPNLHDDEVTRLVDRSDNALYTLDPVSPTFRKFLRRFGWVCGTRGTLPKSCRIPETSLLNASNQPFASGALTDMYEGYLRGSRVRIEKVRVYSEGSLQGVKRTFCKRVAMRKCLRHKNIVPFLGATLDPPQFVSAWIPGGGLIEYVTTHPMVDRVRLLYEVAQGLDYLHSHGIIHGDLKASNILIDAAGHARVAGLDLIVASSNVGPTPSTTRGPVWLAAPEVLGTGTGVSKEADIFSFAMTVVEVFTGAAPFGHLPPTAVAARIVSGKRPGRPEHPSLTDDLWDLNQRCWAQEPSLRPKVSEVVRHVQTSLAVQEGHADGTDESINDDTTSTSSRKREVSHRLSYVPPHPTATRWLLALRKPFDERSCTEPNGSEDDLYDAKTGEWEKPLYIQHPPSSSHSLLRMVVDWLPGRRTRSTRNRGASHDDFPEKYSREEAEITLPDLIAGTAPESTQNPENLHPTRCRSLPCLPSCRSNKHMD